MQLPKHSQPEPAGSATAAASTIWRSLTTGGWPIARRGPRRVRTHGVNDNLVAFLEILAQDFD
jgi:hypothetical protein